MARRAPRGAPRPPARRGGAAYRRALRLPPLVNGFGIEWVSPVNGYKTRDRRQEIVLIPRSIAMPTPDVQVEWRTTPAVWNVGLSVWQPTATYTTDHPDVPRNEPLAIEPPTDLTYTSWWYRARVGDSSTNTWSDWSPQQYFDVLPILGSVTEYIDINIGIEQLTRLDAAVQYVEMNIGVQPTLHPILTKYIAMNIGVESRLRLGAEYSDMNIHPPLGNYQAAVYTDINAVTDETPVPHIWWIRPEQGREGLVFNIYGHGFGAFQNQYDGQVRLGNLVCTIARWEQIPAQLLAGTVKVSGRPRATASTTDMPYVLINNTATHMVQAGDILEYDMMWEVPSGQRLDIFPNFDISSTAGDMGYGASALLNDTTGDAWISDQPEAYGAWHHRRFVVPSGHFLVGKTLSNFRVQWEGFNPAQPIRTGSIRSFVIRRADESVALWVTGDDQLNTPSLTYVANTGTLDYTEYDQAGHVIEKGVGLGSDTITPEHGWIVAVVPSGATSSMVRVVLEDD